jgi:tetratricopeptide (TPR) repeat protein
MRSFLLFYIFCWSFNLDAQDPRLAQQYFVDGEYEKAAVLFQSLYQKNPSQESFFTYYLNCLTALGRQEESESLIKKEIANRPKEASLYILYGNQFIKKNELDKAEKQFKLAIDKLQPDVIMIHKVANAFIDLSKFDLAIDTYEKGEKIMKGQTHFTYNLADLYRRKGELDKMLNYYLAGLDDGSVNLLSLQNILNAYLPKDKHKDFQSLLYEKLSSNPDQVAYIELLLWTFIQSKDYLNALRQAKALDKRLNENGNRVFNIGNIAANDTDYKTAIDAFTYVRDKGPIGSSYLEAYRQVLICRRKQIVEKNNYNQQDLIALETDYENFKKEYSGSRLSAPIIIEYAELESRYLNQLNKGIALLEELIKNPALEPHIKAQAKLDLADYYLIQGERWEATLLYSQVDKDFQEDQLGELARFKNARLSYFAGDFQWAQEQFDILKQATSKLISNDAIDMSVFILDNINQDTLGEALTVYSQAELNVLQNKYTEALILLDTILSQFPKNSLLDDVLFLQAKIFDRQKRTEDAIKKYELILQNHKEEIRADNALFEMARIYEYQLDQKEKAKELYEKLFIDFSGSTLAVEARKRYRILRGDQIQ